MIWRFEAAVSPAVERIASLAEATPHTPFNSTAYAGACAAVGKIPCILLLRAEPDAVEGCLAFLERHLFFRRLTIVTAPRVTEPVTFWDGVWSFCRRHGVWELDVQSFGSDVSDIPARPGELRRRSRSEFILDLDSSSLFHGMPPKRRHDIERARRAGLTIRRTRELSASGVHLKLMQDSARRRRARGQDVPIPNDRLWLEVLLTSGAAELFLAVDGNKAFASAMIVRSNISAYYHSAGSSPEGMKVGAAAFLVSETARTLCEEGLRLFNLGGTDQTDQSLRFFKASFGTREVMLQTAMFSMVSPALQSMVAMGRHIRHRLAGVFLA